MSETSPTPRAFEIPGRYYEIIRQDFRDLAGELDFFRSYLPTGGSFLDIGCGTGTVLRPLAADGYRCVGVDQSSTFIDYARKLGGGPEYHHVHAADFTTDEQFDVVAAIFVTLNYLCHADVRKVLGLAAKWLKPGGRLVIDIAHLLNFVDAYEPYIIAHHYDGETVITRLIRHQVDAHAASWRHEETILVAEGQAVSMHHNAFDQIVLTVPEVESHLKSAGLTVTERFGNFRKARPSARGKGHLILVAEHA